MAVIVPDEIVEERILLVRAQKVMLDRDLAELYGVETRVLNQAVKRNKDRFPEDFMFQITPNEADLLVSQNVMPHKKYFGGSLPNAFTEQGVAMLSGVLKSKRAVKVNIAIMRAFVKLRKMLSTQKKLAQKLNELEGKVEGHDEEIHPVRDQISCIIPMSFKAKKIVVSTLAPHVTYVNA